MKKVMSTYLGYTISDQTVGNILKRHRISPAPERKKTLTWRAFIRCHLDVLMATDFFNSELWSGVRFLISCLFGFIDAGRHQVQAVRMFRHQRMLEMHAFLIHVLNVQAQRTRWNSWIRRVTRSGAIRFGEAHPFNPISEIPPHEERHHQLQPMGNVVLLSAVCSGQIRAGPMQHRHRFGGLLEGDYPEAA